MYILRRVAKFVGGQTRPRKAKIDVSQSMYRVTFVKINEQSK